MPTNGNTGPPSDSPASAPLPDVPSARRVVREVNGVELHAVAAGDEADPLVVLLHGFPEFWYGWREYVEPFVDAGYRVLVPDQRGYNRSDKPDGLRSYRLSELSGDVVGLVESEGRERTQVVGHDWGGIVAWDLALRHPEVIGRLSVVNGPHPAAFREALDSNPAQRRKSQYVFSFQESDGPERRLARDDFETLVGVMRGGANPGTFTETDVERYKRAWAVEGALTAMLDWYRALVQVDDCPPRERVAPPTLVVWGVDDQALVPELAGQSLDYCEDGKLERFPDATHWVLHEYPERVASLLLAHLDA